MWVQWLMENELPKWYGILLPNGLYVSNDDISTDGWEDGSDGYETWFNLNDPEKLVAKQQDIRYRLKQQGIELRFLNDSISMRML